MSLMDDLFSPLGRKYCVGFYWLSVFSFISLLFSLFASLMLILKGGRRKMFKALVSPLVPLLMYLGYRLLYGMCENSTS